MPEKMTIPQRPNSDSELDDLVASLGSKGEDDLHPVGRVLGKVNDTSKWPELSMKIARLNNPRFSMELLHYNFVVSPEARQMCVDTIARYGRQTGNIDEVLNAWRAVDLTREQKDALEAVVDGVPATKDAEETRLREGHATVGWAKEVIARIKGREKAEN
jgi:hypothetical protein